MMSEDVRLEIYRCFATTGRPPSNAEIGAALDLDDGSVAAALADLQAGRHLLLDRRGAIVMAHPFSAVNLGFSVMGRSTLWWGGCAWDAFALPHLLPSEKDVLVATRCPGCGRALAWVVGRTAPPTGDEVAHFLVPSSHLAEDVLRACSHQRLFCDPTCVGAWLAGTGRERGHVLDLPTLWRLAGHWYDGRLDRGYRHRSPAAAADYFREVGLSGVFWGL